MTEAKRQLPGWQGEFGVDFSAYRIGGTSCANCRSLLTTTPPLTCGSEAFVAADTPGKEAGEDTIPVDSGDPRNYCCSAWGLSEEAAKRKPNRTAAWATKARAG